MVIKIFNKQARDAIQRMKNKLDRFNGPGIINTPDALSLTQLQTPRVAPVNVPRFIVAKVTTTSTADGLYDATEQVWDDSDLAWIDRPNGLTWGSDQAGGDLLPLREMHGWPLVALDQFVTVTRSAGDEGTLLWLFTSPRTFIYVKLSSATSDGTNKWHYAGDHYVRTTTGWAAHSAGATISASGSAKFLNSIEQPNDGAGVQGHGVDIDGADYPAGFSVQSIDVGLPIVKAYPDLVGTSPDLSIVWTLEAQNADDGTCT